LTEHNLVEVPFQVYELANITTLDISNNKLKDLPPNLTKLTKLKSLKCDKNLLPNGSLSPTITQFSNLQILSAGENKLGQSPVESTTSKNYNKKRNKKSSPTRSPFPFSFPSLPPSLKQLKLESNHFKSVPLQICDPLLLKLEKLDLSRNNLLIIPPEIANLSSLTELNLDGNILVSLPEEVGDLGALKALSLQDNQIQVNTTCFSDEWPQPLPVGLFQDTPLIDLNLRGNNLTNTQLNQFEGFDKFLERRQNVKSKNIYGGALTDLGVCGLE